VTDELIVLDTSALMAVLLDEPRRDAITTLLSGNPRLAMSAGTMVECFIVARRRGLENQMRAALDRLAPEILSVDEAAARRIDAAFARFGRGAHPAGLNFGDMFAYDAAARLGAALLYVGEDFAATDLRPALA
jgi:ribonuclease VapC